MADIADRVIDYGVVFESEAGKKVLYDLMLKHWILSPHPHVDPSENAFCEGERSVVLGIMAKLEIDPIELRKKIKEGMNNGGYYGDKHID
jgi:hypothetical protein